jgi:hypothetical protein
LFTENAKLYKERRGKGFYTGINESARIDLYTTIFLTVEWDILGVPAERNVKFYTCCDEPYLDITFNITMRRNNTITSPVFSYSDHVSSFYQMQEIRTYISPSLHTLPTILTSFLASPLLCVVGRGLLFCQIGSWICSQERQRSVNRGYFSVPVLCPDTEAEFFDVIGTQVLRVFLLSIHKSLKDFTLFALYGSNVIFL